MEKNIFLSSIYSEPSAYLKIIFSFIMSFFPCI